MTGQREQVARLRKVCLCGAESDAPSMGEVAHVLRRSGLVVSIVFAQQRDPLTRTVRSAAFDTLFVWFKPEGVFAIDGPRVFAECRRPWVSVRVDPYDPLAVLPAIRRAQEPGYRRDPDDVARALLAELKRTEAALDRRHRDPIVWPLMSSTTIPFTSPGRPRTRRRTGQGHRARPGGVTAGE